MHITCTAIGVVYSYFVCAHIMYYVNSIVIFNIILMLKVAIYVAIAIDGSLNVV